METYRGQIAHNQGHIRNAVSTKSATVRTYCRGLSSEASLNSVSLQEHRISIMNPYATPQMNCVMCACPAISHVRILKKYVFKSLIQENVVDWGEHIGKFRMIRQSVAETAENFGLSDRERYSGHTIDEIIS